jgi:hypothetical protein
LFTQKRNYIAILIAIALTLSFIGLTVTPARALSTPTITLLPPAGPVKTPITVKGTNFTPGNMVNLAWFGYIVDVPGISGHVGYYPIKQNILVAPDGSFVTTIIAPYDFCDITHYVNATQNGVGTGIVNATFTIVPSLQLGPQPSKYKEGQTVTLFVYGAPRGPEAVALGLTPRPTVLKFTYDNGMWGYATSHFVTEGPIVSGGFVGGDIGGNATITFKATGGVGTHVIRAYEGDPSSSLAWLPCILGGEAVFSIAGISINIPAQASLDPLTSLNSISVYVLLLAISVLVLLAIAVRMIRKR